MPYTGSSGFGLTKPSKGMRVIPGADRVRLDLPGAAGFGDAGERDPDAVREDVSDELISPEAAKRDYGVESQGPVTPLGAGKPKGKSP